MTANPPNIDLALPSPILIPVFPIDNGEIAATVPAEAIEILLGLPPSNHPHVLLICDHPLRLHHHSNETLKAGQKLSTDYSAAIKGLNLNNQMTVLRSSELSSECHSNMLRANLAVAQRATPPIADGVTRTIIAIQYAHLHITGHHIHMAHGIYDQEMTRARHILRGQESQEHIRHIEPGIQYHGKGPIRDCNPLAMDSSNTRRISASSFLDSLESGQPISNILTKQFTNVSIPVGCLTLDPKAQDRANENAMSAVIKRLEIAENLYNKRGINSVPASI